MRAIKKVGVKQKRCPLEERYARLGFYPNRKVWAASQ
jgi:hypothetical protein